MLKPTKYLKKLLLCGTLFIYLLAGLTNRRLPHGKPAFLAPASALHNIYYAFLQEEYLKFYSQVPLNYYFHAEHVRRVTDFTFILGKEMQLSEQERDSLYKAALLHDLGSRYEDITVSMKLYQFIKDDLSESEKQELNWYHKTGLFTDKESQADLSKTTRFLMDNSKFLKKFKMTRNELKTHLQGIVQFTPNYSIFLAKKNKIPLTPLVEALIRFHHTTPRYITKDNLRKTFPGLTETEFAALFEQLHRLLPLLITADTLEASNNRIRGTLAYARDKETIEDLFKYMNQRLQIGEINTSCYNTVVELLQRRDANFLKVIFDCRQKRQAKRISSLPPEDLIFIENLTKITAPVHSAVLTPAADLLSIINQSA